MEPIKYKKFEAKLGTSIILENLPTYFRNHILSTFNMLFKPLRSTIDLQLGLSEKGNSLMDWSEKNNSSPMSKLLKSTSTLTIALVFLQLNSIVLLWLSVIYGLINFIQKKRAPNFFYYITIHCIFLYHVRGRGGICSFSASENTFSADSSECGNDWSIWTLKK